MDTACVWCKFPLDTLDGEHVSTLRHMSTIQHVQWKLPLDTSHTHKILNPRLIVQVGDLSLIWIWTNYIKLICLIYL